MVGVLSEEIGCSAREIERGLRGDGLVVTRYSGVGSDVGGFPFGCRGVRNGLENFPLFLLSSMSVLWDGWKWVSLLLFSVQG
jgi:hypothetical protein